MANIEAYYGGIAEEKAKLDKDNPTGFVFTMSVRNPAMNSTAGTVAEVSTKIAARQLVDGTARVATPKEVTDFQARGVAFAERMQARAFTNHKRHDANGVVHIIRGK